MSYPIGVIPRVEHQWSHRAFVEAVTPDCVMVDYVSARQIVKNGKDADSYFGEDVDVITTTTVPDHKLDLVTWERERDYVTDFGPDYHIPTDYSIYGHHSKDERIEALEKMVEGTFWMRDQLADADIEILPQVKGFSPRERKITYQMVDELETEYACYYATQYFTGSGGVRIDELVSDLDDIDVETPDWDVLVIGLLAPNTVEKVPENVRAVSGQKQWRVRVAPRDNTDSKMQSEYEELKDIISNRLPRRD